MSHDPLSLSRHNAGDRKTKVGHEISSSIVVVTVVVVVVVDVTLA